MIARRAGAGLLCMLFAAVAPGQVAGGTIEVDLIVGDIAISPTEIRIGLRVSFPAGDTR